MIAEPSAGRPADYECAARPPHVGRRHSDRIVLIPRIDSSSQLASSRAGRDVIPRRVTVPPPPGTTIVEGGPATTQREPPCGPRGRISAERSAKVAISFSPHRFWSNLIVRDWIRSGMLEWYAACEPAHTAYIFKLHCRRKSRRCIHESVFCIYSCECHLFILVLIKALSSTSQWLVDETTSPLQCVINYVFQLVRTKIGMHIELGVRRPVYLSLFHSIWRAIYLVL